MLLLLVAWWWFWCQKELQKRDMWRRFRCKATPIHYRHSPEPYRTDCSRLANTDANNKQLPANWRFIIRELNVLRGIEEGERKGTWLKVVIVDLLVEWREPGIWFRSERDAGQSTQSLNNYCLAARYVFVGYSTVQCLGFRWRRAYNHSCPIIKFNLFQEDVVEKEWEAINSPLQIKCKATTMQRDGAISWNEEN